MYVPSWGCEFTGKGYLRKPEKLFPHKNDDSTVNIKPILSKKNIHTHALPIPTPSPRNISELVDVIIRVNK